LPADREFPEIDAEVPAAPRTTQRERDIALGHHGAIGRCCRAGMRSARDVGSEDLVDVEDAGELADPFNLLLAEGQAAALAAQVDAHVLAVAAADVAAAAGSLVERRPAVDLKMHLAADFTTRGVRVAGVQHWRASEQRAENEVACDGHDGLLLVVPKLRETLLLGSMNEATDSRRDRSVSVLPQSLAKLALEFGREFVRAEAMVLGTGLGDFQRTHQRCDPAGGRPIES